MSDLCSLRTKCEEPRGTLRMLITKYNDKQTHHTFIRFIWLNFTFFGFSWNHSEMWSMSAAARLVSQPSHPSIFLQILAHQSHRCGTQFPPHSPPSLPPRSTERCHTNSFPPACLSSQLKFHTIKDTPAIFLNILVSVCYCFSLSRTKSLSLLSPACPSFSIAFSPPRYHFPSYSDEFQIERGTLLISSVKMLCCGQCGHQCVH